MLYARRGVHAERDARGPAPGTARGTAAAELGAAGVTLLVFDDTGITGHPDHKAATAAAVLAARLHASQVSPGAVLRRRLQLQGDCEYLRWLVPPRDAAGGR